MKQDTSGDVVEVKRNGISVRIRPTPKNGSTYFVLDYQANGQRKLVWRSSLEDAKHAANDAIEKITEGQAEVLSLKSADAHAFTRSRAILNGGDGETKIELEIDEAIRIAADCLRLLGGRASPQEVCREWLQRHAVALPRVTVLAAVELMKSQAETDGKSDMRLKQLANVLDRFANNINQEVHTLTPKLVADYLTALELAERTRRNHRDVIGFLTAGWFCAAIWRKVRTGSKASKTTRRASWGRSPPTTEVTPPAAPVATQLATVATKGATNKLTASGREYTLAVKARESIAHAGQVNTKLAEKYGWDKILPTIGYKLTSKGWGAPKREDTIAQG